MVRQWVPDYILYLNWERNDFMNEKMFYSVSEAAEFLGVSKATMYRYLREGAVKAIKLNDSSWKIPVKALKELAGILA